MVALLPAVLEIFAMVWGPFRAAVLSDVPILRQGSRLPGSAGRTLEFPGHAHASSGNRLARCTVLLSGLLGGGSRADRNSGQLGGPAQVAQVAGSAVGQRDIGGEILDRDPAVVACLCQGPE